MNALSLNLMVKLIMRSKIKTTELNNKMLDVLNEKYGSSYAKKVLSAIDVEYQLMSSSISGKLQNTKATLFKANTQMTLFKDLFADNIINTEELGKLSDYELSLSDNNVDAFIKHLKVINLLCNHGNI